MNLNIRALHAEAPVIFSGFLQITLPENRTVNAGAVAPARQIRQHLTDAPTFLKLRRFGKVFKIRLYHWR
jgi:hypothetical protein